MVRRRTHCVNLFLQMADAMTRGIPMIPRSGSDKEFFAQDWFRDRAKSLGVEVIQQGRNSYPDFWLIGGNLREGYEVKSLAFANGRPARKDIDFNSTIPSGRKQGSDVFLVFFLYTGSGAQHRTVHSLVLAHCDLLNSDHQVADAHINVAIHEFGSYGDGFIRNRKMYVFPHPVTIDPTALGRGRLVVPEDWGLDDPRLRAVGSIERQIAAQAITEYSVDLRGKPPRIHAEPYKNASKKIMFAAFEVA
jgi:hypothetical protein